MFVQTRKARQIAGDPVLRPIDSDNSNSERIDNGYVSKETHLCPKEAMSYFSSVVKIKQY